jgi:hypothetical protein
VGVAGGADSVASKLVSGLATSLASRELNDLLSVETLRDVGADSLEILARHPRLVGNDEFATRVVGAALIAAARVVGTATSPAELLDVIEATVSAAADNLSLVRVDDRLAAVITAFSKAVSTAGLQSSLSTAGRKALLAAMVDAVMTNPVIWGELTANELVEPLAEAIARGLKDDPGRLLTGATLVPSLSRILVAAARRGRVLLEGEVEPDTLRLLLAASLARAEKEVGRTIDAETLPDFLERVVTRFLGDPVEIGEAALDELFNEVLEAA